MDPNISRNPEACVAAIPIAQIICWTVRFNACRSPCRTKNPAVDDMPTRVVMRRIDRIANPRFGFKPGRKAWMKSRPFTGFALAKANKADATGGAMDAVLRQRVVIFENVVMPLISGMERSNRSVRLMTPAMGFRKSESKEKGYRRLFPASANGAAQAVQRFASWRTFCGIDSNRLFTTYVASALVSASHLLAYTIVAALRCCEDLSRRTWKLILLEQFPHNSQVYDKVKLPAFPRAGLQFLQRLKQ
jgi:hypothetical protein